jgi:iron complex outermembrane receptor protein
MKQTKANSAFPSRMSMVAIACQLTCLSMSSAYAQETTSNDPVDSKQVTITGKKVGMGLMVQENAPKARSTITAEELAKQRPTGNAYEALELMPAVNSYNYDATGLFGGGLTLRGFNSDQIGATINGVPVNDSGSFAVYPQEFVDQENTCTQFVTQGSTDVDSPQVGATGGNFGITTCDPSKEKRFRVMQTFGGLGMIKTYGRYDSGLWKDGKTRMFLSYSHAESEKWKGEGGARRDHVDFGFRSDFDRFNSVAGTILYNRAINSNINSISLAQLATYGYYYDYANVFAGHAAKSPGTAVSDPSQSAPGTYYGLSQNPFENVIASSTLKMRIGSDTDIKVIPYYWYGYGTGGSQQRLQAENAFLNPATHTNIAAVDLNGDGDTKDKVWVASSSVTRTNRPGVTASATHNFENHQVLAGFWYERATHEQSAPMQAVDSNGGVADIWFKTNLITRPDGSLFQARDWKTISTAYQFFAQDTISLMQDKLTVNVGVRLPTIRRDFTNFANEGTSNSSTSTIYNGAGYTYNISRSYSEPLPQLGIRYQIDNNNQLFASLARNMKAPGNFIFATSNNVVVAQTGPNAGIPTMPQDVKAETSYNLDLGYRHQSDKLTAQVSLYAVDFTNRLLTSYDYNTGLNSLINVGKVRNNGFEVELGNTPVNGWSFYSSLGYAQSTVKSNLTLKSGILPTSGKELTNTPDWKAGLSAQYETGVWYARLKAKYTGSQWATLANDEKAPAYTLLGFDAGYQFANTTWMKKPTIRLNVSNLTNKQYRNPASTTYTNATQIGTIAPSTAYYYLGAPRFTSVTFSADF